VHCKIRGRTYKNTISVAIRGKMQGLLCTSAKADTVHQIRDLYIYNLHVEKPLYMYIVQSTRGKIQGLLCTSANADAVH
jgi:hypothetical protein